MTQSISGVIDALVAACPTIFADVVDETGAPVQVVTSRPGQYQANYIVAVATEVRQQISRPTTGPSRTREAAAEVDIVISVYVPGGEDVQQQAIDRALSMQGLLETYLRTSPNETLGGACRDSFVSDAVVMPEIAFQQLDDPNFAPAPMGRIAENTVTVTAFIRY
jgi:hypothetical protein